MLSLQTAYALDNLYAMRNEYGQVFMDTLRATPEESKASITRENDSWHKSGQDWVDCGSMDVVKIHLEIVETKRK